VVYFKLGQTGFGLIESKSPRAVVQLPTTEAIQNQASSEPVTKASKQAKSRKTVSKKGEWLLAKTKRKKPPSAANTKKRASKKSKTAPKTRKTALKGGAAQSSEVIEILSDIDDADKKISAKRCDLWEDQSSDDELEFE
jgi:hypothetical protein